MKIFALVLLSALSAAAQTTWVTVRDTREHAFSIDVPKSWTIRGGMFRLGPIDSRPLVVMASTDGRSNIQIGDRMIPAYTMPSAAGDRWGITEGKFAPVLGSWPIVARYRPANEYIAKYGVNHFGQMCQSPQVKQITAVPNRIIKIPYPGGQLTAAEGYFVCTANGQQMLGYVYAETYSAGQGLAGVWYVGAIGSFLAPVEQAKEVGELLAQSWKTMAFNPVWAKAQNDLVNAIAAKSSVDLRRHLAESQAQFEKTMNAIHQQGDTFSDILTGTTLTKDPATGQVHEINTGTGGHYWMNGQNVVVESSLSPGPGYHELQTISH
jgi:hypothetical protein